MYADASILDLTMTLLPDAATGYPRRRLRQPQGEILRILGRAVQQGLQPDPK